MLHMFALNCSTIGPELAIFDYMIPPKLPGSTELYPCGSWLNLSLFTVHIVFVLPSPLLSLLFSTLITKIQYHKYSSSSQAILFITQQNPLPKNSWITHIGSANVKTQSCHCPMLYMLCAALADHPDPLNLEGM